VTWAGLVWKNLWRRPTRTALTATGVALGVGLIVALLSISAGVSKTAGDLIHVGRADFGLFQRDASDLTKSLLPASLEQRIAADKDVAQTARLFPLRDNRLGSRLGAPVRPRSARDSRTGAS
jgi:hypothetical protein